MWVGCAQLEGHGECKEDEMQELEDRLDPHTVYFFAVIKYPHHHV